MRFVVTPRSTKVKKYANIDGSFGTRTWRARGVVSGLVWFVDHCLREAVGGGGGGRGSLAAWRVAFLILHRANKRLRT